MKFKKYLFFFLFFFITLINCSSQQLLSTNLVPNPSFEDHYICPSTWSQINYAKNWFAEDSLGGSSDFGDFCSSSNYILNWLQSKHPRTGNAMAGIRLLGTPNWNDYIEREYIESFTTDNLYPNKKYKVTFYVNLSFVSIYAISNIGMYFSKKFIKGSVARLIILTPQIKNNNGIITDTANWTVISGILEPTDTLKYFIIGNFDTITNVNYITFNSAATFPNFYNIDDVSVYECSFNFNLGNDTILCTGNSIILNPNMPNAIYTWQDSSHATTYTVTQSGTYWVRAFFPDYNITTYDTINVYYKPSPIVNLGKDTTLCNNEIIVLNASYLNCTYIWQDSTTNAIYNVNKQGVYWVTVTESNNCSATDSITIIYQHCENPINIPNAFTPNGDGKNDVFKIISLNEIIDFKLIIYNRWGELLYESDDINKGWDGTFKGKTVPQDVYIYLLTGIIKDTGDQIKRTGSVTVLR